MTTSHGEPESLEEEENGHLESGLESGLHPVVARAADGIVPDWARAGEERRAHMARVADVLESWARSLHLESRDVLRWRSLGFLHDALRDAAVDDLRSMMESVSEAGSEEASGWGLDRQAFSLDRVSCPGDSVDDRSRGGDAGDAGDAGDRPDLDDWAPVGGSLHGPAVAIRLAREGVEDDELLSAVAYHTVGHPDLGPAGRALYCADFVEPGRSSGRERRADLRARYPKDPSAVLRDVLRARIGYLLDGGRPIFLGTARMWNRANRTA